MFYRYYGCTAKALACVLFAQCIDVLLLTAAGANAITAPAEEAAKNVHRDIDLAFEMRNATADDGSVRFIETPWLSSWIIGSPLTIDCPFPEYPILRILGGQYANVTANATQIVTCEGGYHVRGCPYTLRIAHQCSGVSGNCSVSIEQPDEMQRCPVAHYQIRYQCLPKMTSDDPLRSYATLPPGVDASDPCAALYVPSQ
ncbi:uncharacterized protein LOC129592333 [Paramacrobiotus metropolitanus]|uniref:uncharacterized protein LOC129592333 n=1 Tax=Paramacrobiotus metropolitanus TaxID=2943436 RepID=UPI002445EF7B|nr:uncharacterized protein LOC129592333 [Paramacrobiotus metropolitanus]